jgi:muconate cycloisomerase
MLAGRPVGIVGLGLIGGSLGLDLQAAAGISVRAAKPQIAAIAQAADIGWYGGTMLETSIGSAASAHVFATLGGRHHNCELFGPQLLVDDIVAERMPIADFALQLPDGPGLGVEVDPAQLDRFDRARQGLQPTHIDLAAAPSSAPLSAPAPPAR